jgi:hypothetical protein
MTPPEAPGEGDLVIVMGWNVRIPDEISRDPVTG